jgi:phosphate transport system protein
LSRHRRNSRGDTRRFISTPSYANLKNVIKFGEGLEHLRGKLLEMSSLVEMGIFRSVQAVVHKDRSAAEEVLANENRINSIQLQIDGLAIELLALYQPMASSLRFIVAALKINTDLERMGDLSVNIAQSAQLLIDAPASPTVVDIPFIAGLAQSMVRESIDAFVACDVALARDVLASDDAVDEFRTDCYQQLIACMENDSATIKPALSLLTVIRTLERLADHATNIAEDVLFYVEGIDVRHNSGLNDLRQARS